MSGLKENSGQKEQRQRSGWNRALIDAMKNKESLAKLSQQARNEILSTEYLSRPSPKVSDGSIKMAAAGDDIGL